MSDDDKPKKRVISVLHDDDEAVETKSEKDVSISKRKVLKESSDEDTAKPELAQLEELKAKPRGVKLEPLSDQSEEKPGTDEAAPAAEPVDGPAEPTDTKKDPKPQPAITQEPETPVAPTEESETDEASAKTDEADQPPATEDSIVQSPDSPDQVTKEEEQAAAKQAEHEAEIEKLVASEKYVLPINTVEKRRAKRTLLLGIILSIVLALAWVNIALDAGLIQLNGVEPLTHFFST